MTQEELDKRTKELTCKFGMKVVNKGSYSVLEPSEACRTQGAKEAKKRPWKKANTSGACQGIRGKGPYDFIFSDGSTRQAYGLTCQEALREAKRTVPRGVFVIEAIPL